MSRKGFTLVEVLIVVVIAVVVTMFSVPAYKKAQDRSRYMSAAGTLMDVGNGVRMLMQEYPDLEIDTLTITANNTSSDENPTTDNVVGWLQSNKYMSPIPLQGGKHKGYVLAISTMGTASCTESCEPADAVACMCGDNLLEEYKCAWVTSDGILRNN